MSLLVLGGILYAFLGEIANILLQASMAIIDKVLMNNFMTDFRFFGYASETTETVRYFFIFKREVTSIDTEITNAGGALISYFFEVIGVQDIIFSIAWILFGLIIAISAYKLIVGPLVGERGSSPINIFGRMILTTILIYFSSSILYLVFSAYTSLITPFTQGVIPYINASASSASGANGVIGFLNSLVTSLGTGGTLSNAAEFGVHQYTYILYCILSMGLGTSIITSTLSYIERYLSLAITVYLGPIALAFYGSEETSNVTKDWVMSLIQQCIGIIVNIWMFAMAFEAMRWNYANYVNAGWTGLPDLVMTEGYVSQKITAIVLCLAFLSLARNSEKFFNAMGFRTMPNGDLARSFATGLATLGSGAMIAMRAVGGATKALGGAPKAIGGANALSGTTGNKFGGGGPIRTGENGLLQTSSYASRSTKESVDSLNKAISDTRKLQQATHSNLSQSEKRSVINGLQSSINESTSKISGETFGRMLGDSNGNVSYRGDKIGMAVSYETGQTFATAETFDRNTGKSSTIAVPVGNTSYVPSAGEHLVSTNGEFVGVISNTQRGYQSPNGEISMVGAYLDDGKVSSIQNELRTLDSTPDFSKGVSTQFSYTNPEISALPEQHLNSDDGGVSYEIKESNTVELEQELAKYMKEENSQTSNSDDEVIIHEAVDDDDENLYGSDEDRIE